MRELSVYYCPKCGYYGYYQMPKAACPRCSAGFRELPVPIGKFMELDCTDRDKIIACEIVNANPYISDLAVPDTEFDSWKILKSMEARAREREEANEKLKDTVAWMQKMMEDLKKSDGSH